VAKSEAAGEAFARERSALAGLDLEDGSPLTEAALSA
jgi:hypothetical protein